jgi:protein-disulfide isomerase
MASQQSGVNRFYLILGAVAVIGVGVLVYLSLGRGAVSIPANVTVTEADTAGFRGYILGSADAPVEITEYADYQCPACADFATVQFPDVKTRLIQTGRLRWRYRDFPLDFPYSRLAMHAAACADDQGRFLEFHERIYAGHPVWNRGGAERVFRGYAQALGLDVGAYDDCMQSARHAGRIQASLQEGVRLGVNSTPTFLVGGRLYPGRLTYDQIRRMVDSLAAVAPAP